MQVIINQLTREIICTDFDKGRRHDFYLFKKSKVLVNKEIQLLADKGYQGIHRYHKASLIPHKKTKKKPLTFKQRAENRSGAKIRVTVENVIRCSKFFGFYQVDIAIGGIVLGYESI